MNAWISEFFTKCSVDGLRIYTAKHICRDFWPGFTQSTSVFAIGEVMCFPNDFAGSEPYLLLDHRLSDGLN
jgi:alpha-amylase